MRDGAINIIPLDVVSGGDAVAQVATVMGGYPNMTAPRSLAEPMGAAAFETQRWLGGQTCNTRDKFTYVPLQRLIAR